MQYTVRATAETDPCPKRAIPFENHAKKFKKGKYGMKAKLIMVLHLFGLDVLLLGLVEKFLLGLTKKLTALKNAAQRSLDRVKKLRND